MSQSRRGPVHGRLQKLRSIPVYRKSSDRSPRLQSVQVTLTPSPPPACIRDPASIRTIFSHVSTVLTDEIIYIPQTDTQSATFTVT